MNLLLTEVVNNANNNIYVKEGGFAEQGIPESEQEKGYYGEPSNEEGVRTENGGLVTVYSFKHEKTLTLFNNTGENTVTHTTIWINKPAEVKGENGKTIKQDKARLLWHGIGHGLTNIRLKVGLNSPNAKVNNTAQKQTVGFENFVLSLYIKQNKNTKPRTGDDHGTDEQNTESHGTDNYYKDESSKYKETTK